MRPQKVLLIVPHGNLPNYFFPLALGYLKANTPGPHQVKILDLPLERIQIGSVRFTQEIETFRPDVAGLTASSQTYPQALETAAQIKILDPGIEILMGGPHPSIFPNMVVSEKAVDFVLCGEGEASFPRFLDQLAGERDFTSVPGLVYLQGGEIRKNRMELVQDLDRIKIPDYEALGLNRYLDNGYNYGGFYSRTAPIWITRGCPFGCSYCSASLINGRKIRAHTVGYAIRWIEHLYRQFRIRQFAIIDDNFTFDGVLAKEFCREIISLRAEGHFQDKIYFATPNGIRIDRVDDELLGLMKKAGWQGVTIAPESGSKKTLKRMHKKLDPDMVPAMVRRIKASGLKVRAFFMVGYPGETEEDIRLTIRLIRRCKLDAFTIGRFLPYPGTPIFEELVQGGEIEPDYMPESCFKLFLPGQSETVQKMYTPRGLKPFNPFWLMLRENLLLALRNPSSLAYFVRYYGTFNVLKKVLFMARS